MILEPWFGLSLALTVSLELQPPSTTGANVSVHTAVRQKDAKLLPLVHRAIASSARFLPILVTMRD